MVAPTAAVKPARSLSPVWIIPLVALLVGVWLAFSSYRDSGQTVEIVFDRASGIEVNQTEVRYKDVSVGKVTGMRLSEDLTKVRVFVTLERHIGRYLSENSRFWRVSPRISATGVSDLGTLISGEYLVMDPGPPGASREVFEGLDQPPAIHSNEHGTQFVLTAETLGSIDIGSPVYYKQLKVGEVTNYRLGDRGNFVEIRVFVEAPHDQLVLTKSRFWNVSGLSVKVGADGVRADMASLASLIAGGVTFENAVGFEAPERAAADHVFYLYSDRDSVLEERYSLKYFYRLRFSHSLRGLSVGAPVEFRGLKVGEVEDIVLANVADAPQSLHVYISIEPERLDTSAQPDRAEFDSELADLVAAGLRAQLKSGNLLTGSRYIELVFPPGVPPGEFARGPQYSELPTLDHPLDQLDQQIADIAAQIGEIPLAEIGGELQTTLENINTVLGEFARNNTATKIDSALGQLDGTMGDVRGVLADLSSALQSLDNNLAPDTRTQYELSETLKAVQRAADSLNRLAGNLNRKPNSLIFGRDND